MPASAYPDPYGTEFHRSETRRSSRRRELDCLHSIDRGEPYVYSVWKIRTVAGIGQSEICDVCKRDGDSY